MFNFRTALILISTITMLTLSGCGDKTEKSNINSGTANVNNVEVHPDKHWYTPWRKSEEEWKEEDDERERLIAENKEKLKNELIAADKILDTWVTKLDEQRVKGEGFIHHEGRTELDPWGNLIKVGYHQVNLKEWMTIRSLGPDGRQATEDDMVRKKYALNYPGIFDGLDGTGKLVLFWLSSGVVAFFLFSGYAYSGKRRKHHRHTGVGMVGAFLYCVVLAPIACITYLISLIASIGGSDFDLDPFDIDIG
tara:strand:+ start:34501 stop:35253 length:753 start_codon:yes stop_codon:yes gene_type:complete